MPSFETKNFGPIPYQPEAVLKFPCGLPGFEDRRRFLALNLEDKKPLLFLHSLDDPGLCFITMPVLNVDPAYRLEISENDLDLLGLPTGRQPQIGQEVLCLAIVSLEEGGPTANLLAPIVVNLSNLVAVQAIAEESDYSHRQPLLCEEYAVC